MGWGARIIGFARGKWNLTEYFSIFDLLLLAAILGFGVSAPLLIARPSDWDIDQCKGGLPSHFRFQYVIRLLPSLSIILLSLVVAALATVELKAKSWNIALKLPFVYFYLVPLIANIYHYVLFFLTNVYDIWEVMPAAMLLGLSLNASIYIFVDMVLMKMFNEATDIVENVIERRIRRENTSFAQYMLVVGLLGNTHPVRHLVAPILLDH